MTQLPFYRVRVDSERQERSAGGARASRAVLAAVVGNPNCGKTTLFNALTGLRHKVGNYPGVTVEKREAPLSGSSHVHLLDLPGAYSLSSGSADQAITRAVLLGELPGQRRPDVALIVVDASNLERNLFLASQVIDLGLPAVVACNKSDVLAGRGGRLDAATLSASLGVPVVETVASRGAGIGVLRAALESVAQAAAGTSRREPAEAGGPTGASIYHFSDPIEASAGELAAVVRASGVAPGRSARGVALLLLDEDDPASWRSIPGAVLDAAAAARSLLAGAVGDVSGAMARERYAWLGPTAAACATGPGGSALSRTDRVDRVLVHPVWGMAIFACVMAAMFYAVFALADPLMEVIQGSVRSLQSWTTASLPPGAMRGLLRNGVIAGVGAVVSFFPQIALLFVFISVLEDSGYMARAAFLMNRPMSRAGLHGKSFIPLLSSFACTVPGVLATRTIEDPRDRLVTILIAPFMSCGARLPIYTLLIAACLPVGAAGQAAILFGIYALGIGTALGVARLARATLLRGSPAGFVIELPPYHVPRLKPLAMAVWDRCWQFLSKAGSVILAVTIVLWALTSYPRDREVIARYAALRAAVPAGTSSVEAAARREALNRDERAEILRHGVAGRVGRFIEPALRPLGFNWEIGVGILSSFAARELFVGTMAILYSVAESDAVSETLAEQMQGASWPDGRPVFTPLVAVGLMVFYVLSCQCVGTIAVVMQETRSWRWPALMLGYMTALAYLGALVVHQVGTRLGSWG